MLGLYLIPTLFYTYNGVVGKSSDIINIAIFFISGLLAFYFETKLFKGDLKCKRQRVCLLVLIVTGILFVLFTFFTPEIGIFADPVSGNYGI